MRYLDNNEDLSETAIKSYFKERNYFGIPQHICDNANELLVFTQCFIITDEKTQQEAEKILSSQRQEQKEFPFVMLKKYDQIVFAEKTDDFAIHLPNDNKLELYLIRKCKSKI